MDIDGQLVYCGEIVCYGNYLYHTNVRSHYYASSNKDNNRTISPCGNISMVTYMLVFTALVTGVGSTLLRSYLFGKKGTLLRSTILKIVVIDKIENSTLLKRVVVQKIKNSTLLKRVVVWKIENSTILELLVVLEIEKSTLLKIVILWEIENIILLKRVAVW